MFFISGMVDWGGRGRMRFAKSWIQQLYPRLGYKAGHLEKVPGTDPIQISSSNSLCESKTFWIRNNLINLGIEIHLKTSSAFFDTRLI